MDSNHFLPRANSLPPGQDYALLRRKGIEQIERLACAHWTDYNAHDPGITLLELMSYGLTDLSWRASHPVRDMLTEVDQGVPRCRSEFHLAHDQLVSAPVTFDDLRKLLLDIPGIRNAWVQRHDLVSNHGSAGVLRGLFDVFLEYEDIEQIDKIETRESAIRLIHDHRSLCQDLLVVDEVASESVAICADIELAPEADVDDVCAEVLYRVHQQISPGVRFYSMEELFERGRGTERIFEGPRIEHGFIDSDEFSRQEQRCELRVSDMVSAAMQVTGVVAVKSMRLVALAGEEVVSEEQWVLELGKFSRGGATLSARHSKLLFYKRNVPYFANSDRALRRFGERRAAELNARLGKHAQTILPPTGESRNLMDYVPLQNELPNAYCVGNVRVPKSSPPLRHAQARQLKGYLLLMEQLYADYLAQLGNLRRLLCWSEDNDRTYYTQPVTRIRDIEDVYASARNSDQYAAQVAEQLEGSEEALARRLGFLEHLAARYAEDFGDYHAVTRRLYGSDAVARWIGDLRRFLKDYPATSSARGTGFNWRDPKQKSNVSGYQKRICRLLGIADLDRRHLAGHQLTVVSEGSAAGEAHYFELRRSGLVLFTSRTCESRAAAEALLDRALHVGGDTRNYLRHPDRDAYVLMPCDQVADLTESIGETQSGDALEKVAGYFAKFGTSEGFHLVEHILLRPRTSMEPLLATQSDQLGVCPAVGDPYSFQASVILPCWSPRFRDVGFRQFVEDTLRAEAPAHVQLRICWISHQQMVELERVLLPWQNKLAKYGSQPASAEQDPTSRVGLFPLPGANEATTADRAYCRVAARLTNVLQNLTTVYPLARLHDCQDPGRQAPSPVTLDSTSLGTL